MAYRYERERRDARDLAAGAVLRGAPGATAFPVRLASELLQRALEHAPAGRPLVYDPCCGGGYLLTVLGFLHGDGVRGLLGSDVRPEAVELARANLALLDADGLDRRVAQLRRDRDAFGKASHRAALESAARLRESLPGALERRAFAADAGDAAALRAGLAGDRPEVVLSDAPYGRLSGWLGRAAEGGTPALLGALAEAVGPGTVVALATAKDDRPAGAGYERVEQWRVGTRLLTILRRA